MTESVYLTKAPIHALVQTARNFSVTITPYSFNSPRFRHRAVMGLFPEIDSDFPRGRRNILFRLETPAGEAPYFLIQSDIAPTKSSVPEILTKEVELEAPRTGSMVVFRIALNAVRRQSYTDFSGKRSYRVSPVQPDHVDTESETITPWLSHKLSLALADLEITNHRREVLEDHYKKAMMRLQVDSIDGVAVVADESALLTALHIGVGREKAYGCGLLSIKAIP